MADRKKIIETYERMEKESDALSALPRHLFDRVAEELAISRHEVSAAMVSHWTNQGAG